MRKAMSTLETVLIGALVCVIAVAGFTVFNNLKLKLSGMSVIDKSETTGTLANKASKALTPEEEENIDSIDMCFKKSDDKSLCEVYQDKNLNNYVYVETTGTAGKYSIKYLTERTHATSTEECIGQLSMGAKTCVNEKGNTVKCKTDKHGNTTWTEYAGSSDEVVDKGKAITTTSSKMTSRNFRKKIDGIPFFGTEYTITVTATTNGVSTVVSTNTYIEWDDGMAPPDEGEPESIPAVYGGGSSSSGGGSSSSGGGSSSGGSGGHHPMEMDAEEQAY